MKGKAGKGANFDFDNLKGEKWYDPRIKTTVTLDPDVEAALREYARRHGVSFEDALDNAIRSGLAQTRAPASRFQQKTYRLGARTGRFHTALSHPARSSCQWCECLGLRSRGNDPLRC